MQNRGVRRSAQHRGAVWTRAAQGETSTKRSFPHLSLVHPSVSMDPTSNLVQNSRQPASTLGVLLHL